MFTRGEPYELDECKEKYSIVPVWEVSVRLDTSSFAFDLDLVNESYQLAVSGEKVSIVAASPYAASRAFATLMQLVQPLSSASNDMRAYGITECQISDGPRFKWRHYEVDVCSHYQSPASLKKLVDAAALQKLNILLVLFSCAHSFPLKLSNDPVSNLVRGSSSPYHYYNSNDILNL